jgi:hypothetical protein
MPWYVTIILEYLVPNIISVLYSTVQEILTIRFVKIYQFTVDLLREDTNMEILLPISSMRYF